ncbi:hypothetical protein FQN54_008842 [Arachnomyces sp. PD_36]|nr:hypothetical protein FQN54_008842 [Arachnomyces sp. PD_36]
MYSRWARRIKYGWDDWLLVIATMLSIGLIAPYKNYYGIIMSFNLVNNPILPLAKASIILLLLKVGKVIDHVKVCLYGVFVFNLLACVIPWALLIFICPPRTGNTSAETTFGGLKCFDRDQQGKILLFVNCANLFTDIIIFPIPFFIMRELVNADFRSRVMILLTFASSLCVTILSAVKIYVTYRDRILLVSNPDWTYSIEYCISHGESNVGIIVACFPTLRGLISRRFQRTTNRSEREGFNPPDNSGSYYASATRASMPSHLQKTSMSDVEYQLKPPDIMMTTVVENTSGPMPLPPHALIPPAPVHHNGQDESGNSSATELIIQGNSPDDDNPFITTHPSVFEPMVETNRHYLHR